MKYLLILFLFLLTGCWDLSNKSLYKPGDCVVSGDYHIKKIIKVGDRGGFIIENKYGDIENWTSLNGGFTLTDCFNTFDNVNK